MAPPCSLPSAPPTELDWCAGKGHLGRRLQQLGQQLTCLEYDPALVAAGKTLSDHHRLPALHREQDVMAEDAVQHLTREHTPVALHACGDLHVRLLQLASAAGCQHLAVAPCCYNPHRQRAVPGAVGPGPRFGTAFITGRSWPATERNRHRWRAGAPATRHLHGPAPGLRPTAAATARARDEYLPTPSLPSEWLTRPFADYCRHLAALKGLSTGEQDWPTLEQHGWQRLAQVRNLELVRGLFRRPLEVWLVLDRALFLQENGYKAQVGHFCETSPTPRNLMVLAERD